MPFRKLSIAKKSPYLVLVGNFGNENVGDELILGGFLKQLKKQLPKAKVVVLGGNPKLIKTFHKVDALPHLPFGVRSFLRINWWKSLQAVRKSDGVVFPGGGLFSDQEGFRALWVWGMHVLLAKYFWKDVYLLNQSVGEIEGENGRIFARNILKKVEWISLRDEASKKELVKLGIPPSKIKEGKDSSFWLVEKIPKTKNLEKRGRKKILVSLRDFPGIEESFWEEVAKSLDELSEKYHARISFAQFGKGDEEVWKNVKKLAKHAKLWKEMKLPQNVDGVLGEVKKFDVVVGMRLHSLISAKLVGIPSIGFLYSQKVKAFAQNAISIEGFKKEKLLKFFR